MEGLIAFVPIILFLGACLLMMRFMHGGAHGDHAPAVDTSTPTTRLAGEVKKP